jgi:glycosyltransferase involved in cell wall biosynthesis
MNTISVIMPTYNSIRTIKSSLQSIKNQSYPSESIEILTVDGGSTDGTLEILKIFRTTIIKDHAKNPEAAKSVAIKQARGDLILFLPSDNILPHSRWISKMVAVFSKEPEIVAAYPSKYAWRKKDKPLTRYFALIGANDPVAWFLRKADRQSIFHNQKELYTIHTFSEQTLPTVGDNGFMIKRSLLHKAKIDQYHFFHIDVCLDLLRFGFNQFAVTNDTIIHDTGDGFIEFFKKRYRYMSELYLNKSTLRRYKVFNPRTDMILLALFCLYSLTLVGPLFYALYGYSKKQDVAWFIHPIACQAIMITYSLALLKQYRKSV